MKRFFSLLALAAVPAISFAAETVERSEKYTVQAAKDYVTCAPVSAHEETWLGRTDIGVHWGKIPSKLKKSDKRSYTLYSLNTVQPLVRSDDLHNTFFGYAGLGLQSRHGQGIVGLGLRHITAATNNMFGVGVNYSHMSLNHVRYHAPGAYIEWLSQYTSLTLSRFWNQWKVSDNAYKSYLKSNTRGNTTHLDLAFQLPYLPWTQIMLGKTWIGNKIGRKAFSSDYRGTSLAKLDYGLRLNLLGCLSLEGGFLGGWGNNQFVRLSFSYGRAASNEYALADGYIADEAFTPRDLKTQTVAPVSRTRIDTRAMIN